MWTWLIGIGLVALAVVGPLVVSQRRFSSVRTEVQAAIAEGARVVDVRTESEFANGHLPGAINVPVDRIRASMGSLGRKDAPLIVYCASGARSRAAAALLRGQGFQRVLDIGSMANGRRLDWNVK